MIKLLAVDMDGTCLNSKSQMSEETVIALRTAAEKGITVVPTTGRNLTCIPHRLKEEDFYRYAILSNGASVLDLKDNKAVFSSCIPNGTAVELLEKCRKKGFGITAQINKGYYTQGRLLTLIGRLYFGKDADNSICTKSIENMLKESGDEVEEIQLYLIGKKAFAKARTLLKSYDDLSSAYSGFYVEIFDKGASKGTALSALSKHLNIDKSEIACIGDGENDLTMFAASGMKFAMGNAVEELKEKADITLPSNNENGVAEAIMKYIL